MAYSLTSLEEEWCYQVTVKPVNPVCCVLYSLVGWFSFNGNFLWGQGLICIISRHTGLFETLNTGGYSLAHITMACSLASLELRVVPSRRGSLIPVNPVSLAVPGGVTVLVAPHVRSWVNYIISRHTDGVSKPTHSDTGEFPHHGVFSCFTGARVVVLLDVLKSYKNKNPNPHPFTTPMKGYPLVLNVVWCKIKIATL